MRILPYKQILVKSDNEAVDRYAESLCDPWSGGAKIPLGFPVKSTCTQLVYRIPVSIVGSSFRIGSTTQALTTAGSPVSFWFNPNQFDSVIQFQWSATTSPVVHFTDWQGVSPVKGYTTQMASFRLVSAGIKLVYTGAVLYAKGLCFSGSTNARTTSDYSTGATGYANFQSDPDTRLTAFQPGLICEHTYRPIDIDSMNFISAATMDVNNQDWSCFISFDGYDSVNGLSGYFDICVNYETIPFGQYE